MMKKCFAKRILTVVLVIAMVFPLTVSAFAASHPFKDVKDGAWYAKNVQYVYDNGLMYGVSDTQFGPEQSMTRAMLVTVLYRFDGSPAVNGGCPFKDVNLLKAPYYGPAVVWANQNGIVYGTSDTTFSPEGRITREQIVAIFYRYAKYKGLDVSQLANLSKYTDAGRVSGYAVTPFQWAVQASIISGSTPTTLNPKGTATRAECAAVLERFAKWSNGSDSEATPTEPKPTEHTHSYTSEVTKAATCTENGVKTFTCSCGDNYREAISAKGHNWETVYHDEVGHWVGGIHCACGWEFYSKDLSVNFQQIWADHCLQYSFDDQIDYHYANRDCGYYVIDTPAYNTWKCSICGATSETQP